MSPKKDQQLSYAETIRMRMKTTNNPSGKPVTIRMAEAATGYSYEHIRKVVIGEPVASRSLNDALCELLGLDPDTMWKIAQQEKIQRKFGPALADLLPPDPSLKALWSKLSKEDQQKVAKFMRALADAAELTADANRRSA